MEPGSIKVCGQQKRHSYPREKDGWINIPAWSRGARPWNELDHIGDEKHVDEKGGEPNEAWHVWHNELANNPKPIRRPNGYAKPLYAWWEGEKLDVVQARKRIYIPGLQKLYRAHPQYQRLLDLVKGGQSVNIIEPDGPSLSMYPNGMDINLDLLIQLQDVTTIDDFPVDKPERKWGVSGKKYVPYGHGFVLALTLLQDIAQ